MLRRLPLLTCALVLAACNDSTTPAPRYELQITTPSLVNETAPPETPVVLSAGVLGGGDAPDASRIEWSWSGLQAIGNPVTVRLPQGWTQVTAVLRGPDGSVVARDTASIRNPSDTLAVSMQPPCTRHLLRGTTLSDGCLHAIVTANPRGYPYTLSWRLNGNPGVAAPAALPLASLAPGTHAIHVDAVVPGRTLAATASATLIVRDTTVVAGRAWAVTPAGAAAPGPLRVWARVGQAVDSAEVAADGTFRLRSRGAVGDSLDVWIDARNRGARVYHPSWMRLPSARAADELRVLMIPRAWAITRGTFAGRTMGVSMDLAFARTPGEGLSYYYQGAVSWDAARLPVPTLFVRAQSLEGISAADSVELWNVLEALMANDGVRYFAPASEGTPPPHRITVRVDSTIGALGRGGAVADARRYLENGGVAFRTVTVLRSWFVPQHEFRHVLGIGHTCSFPSVMAALDCDRRLLQQTATEWDVAYTDLLHVTHRLQVELSAPYNLREAHNGERLFLLEN